MTDGGGGAGSNGSNGGSSSERWKIETWDNWIEGINDDLEHPSASVRTTAAIKHNAIHFLLYLIALNGFFYLFYGVQILTPLQLFHEYPHTEIQGLALTLAVLFTISHTPQFLRN